MHLRPDTNVYTERYTHSRSGGDGNTHDGPARSDRNTDADTHSYCNPHTSSDCHPCSGPHCHTRSSGDAHAQADRDTDRGAHANTHARPIRLACLCSRAGVRPRRRAGGR